MSGTGGRMYACVDCNEACMQVYANESALMGDLKHSLPPIIFLSPLIQPVCSGISPGQRLNKNKFQTLQRHFINCLV